MKRWIVLVSVFCLIVFFRDGLALAGPFGLLGKSGSCGSCPNCPGGVCPVPSAVVVPTVVVPAAPVIEVEVKADVQGPVRAAVESVIEGRKEGPVRRFLQRVFRRRHSAGDEFSAVAPEPTVSEAAERLAKGGLSPAEDKKLSAIVDAPARAAAKLGGHYGPGSCNMLGCLTHPEQWVEAGVETQEELDARTIPWGNESGPFRRLLGRR